MGDAMKEPWDLVIGQVTAPFGMKGEVCVRPETDEPGRFVRLKEVCLEPPCGEARIMRIEWAKAEPRGVRLKLKGCATREAAEGLRGAWVKIRESMALSLAEDSYWVHDILGMRVVTEEGRELGEVTEVIQAPGNDVYVTPKAMIPAVRHVVRRVDLEGRVMVVSLPPEGPPSEGAET